MYTLTLPLTRFKKDNRKHRNKTTDKEYLDAILYKDNQSSLNLMDSGKILRFDDEDYNIEAMQSLLINN